MSGNYEKRFVNLHQLNPNIELSGLDISEAMIQQARKNLSGIKADLRQGSIQHTSYEDNFFDIVTCTGSLYLWDHPEECLEEIFRILKQSQSAYLFEIYKEVDRKEIRRAVKKNLERRNRLQKLIMPLFLKKALKITYRIDEFAEIIKHTSFANSYAMEKLSLGGVPMWLRIVLTKRPWVISDSKAKANGI